jgi:serine/threonine protein phosphatase PrpC
MVANQPTESRMNPTSKNPQSAEFAPLPEALLGLKTRITSCAIGCEKDQPSADVCDGRPHHDMVIAALADGVGRAELGREAAEKTVANFISYFKSRPRGWSMRKALEEFARLINRSLHQESMTRFERVELLCTAAVAVIEGDRLHGLNVGDSRVYLLRGDKLTQLSVDHAETQPGFQHVLHRSMGMEAEVAPHYFETDVRAGDTVLLCSDGITSLLSDAQIRAQLETHSSARTLISHAREQVKEASQLDDMSAVVIEVEAVDPLSAGSHARLEIPEKLEAGQVVDGFTLKQSFKHSDRTWVATRNGGSFVLKFAPLVARESDAIHSQFVREIWTATRLQADYFARAFVPQGQQLLYYIQEYHPVPTLKHFLAEKPLDVPEAVALAKFLLAAGQFLLSHDLVHGDLKPENILVFRRNDQLDFKLIDFGSITGEFTVTSRAGTPSYLAPERFEGTPLSERTEVFAVGVTVFEALTGKYPYGEIEPFQTPVFHAPQAPTKLNQNIPPWLEAVLLRAITADPEARYQNYSEMKYDLEHPQTVRPFYRKNARLIERNPLLFFKIGFFVLFVINLVLVLILLNRK